MKQSAMTCDAVFPEVREMVLPMLLEHDVLEGETGGPSGTPRNTSGPLQGG